MQTQEQQIRFSMRQGTNLVSEESKNNRCQFLGVGFFQHKDQQIEFSRLNIREQQIFKKRSSLDACVLFVSQQKLSSLTVYLGVAKFIIFCHLVDRGGRPFHLLFLIYYNFI